MGKIIEMPLNFDPGDLAARKGLGFEPDFQIFTSGIEADHQNARLVHMIGSSTEKDLQGDTMSLLALNDMTKSSSNMTIWLNHQYNLPDSIFGSVVGTPAIYHQDGIADLHLSVDVEMDNPAAARVKRYIDNGRKLGCSIGCMVTKYEVPTEEDGENWFENSIIIHGVYVVEYSVVGIPCNQRSWVENAVRGVFQRTFRPELAPAMKSLWPSAYKKAIKSLPQDHREELEQIPSRPRSDARLEWLAERKLFAFSHGTEVKELHPDEVRSLLKSGGIALDVANEAQPEEAREEPEVETAAIDEDKGIEEEDITQKSFDDSLVADGVISLEGEHPEAEAESDPSSVQSGEFAQADAPGQAIKEQDSITQPGTALEEAKEAISPVELPMHIQVLLASYNTLAKSLLLPEIAPDQLEEAQQLASLQKAVAAPSPDMQRLQAIHDMVAAMAMGQVCGNGCENDDYDDASAGTASNGPLAVSYDVAQNVVLMSKAIERYNQATVDLFDVKKEAELTKKELAAARDEINLLAAEVMKAQDAIGALKDMPLGNPVHHNRTVHDATTVSRGELLQVQQSTKQAEAVASDSLPVALELTQVRGFQMGNGQYIKYRCWPEGVGGTVREGVRPELTADQISMMTFTDIYAYREGKEAKVPYLGA